MKILDRLSKLESDATPGLWFNNLYQANAYRVEAQTNPEITPVVWKKSNADLIAESRNALPALIAVARAAKDLSSYLPSGATITADETGAWAGLDRALAALELEEKCPEK